MADWRITPNPRYPRRGNAGEQEPRFFGRGFSPEYQPDIANNEDVFRRLRENGVVPFDDIVSRLDAYNLPPQLIQTTFIAVIAVRGAAGAVQIVPKNPNRMSLLICNFQAPGDNIVMSYDAPIQLNANAMMGVPILTNSIFGESNGSVSINGIFIGCNIASVNFPITVIAYEGALSVSGNARDRGGAAPSS